MFENAHQHKEHCRRRYGKTVQRERTHVALVAEVGVPGGPNLLRRAAVREAPRGPTSERGPSSLTLIDGPKPSLAVVTSTKN